MRVIYKITGFISRDGFILDLFLCEYESAENLLSNDKNITIFAEIDFELTVGYNLWPPSLNK